MVNRDLLMRKIADTKRHIERIRSRNYGSLAQFKKDVDSQDVALFNLQAAIQCCIDIATHLISDNDWGVPSSTGDTFHILCQKKVISDAMRETMHNMAGFRNLIIHTYAKIDFEKVYDVLKHRLDDFSLYLKEISQFAKL